MQTSRDLLEPQLADTLQAGVKKLGLALSAEQQQLMLDYVFLLEKWNQAFNLTAVREPERMLVLHVLDSLAMLPLLDNTVSKLSAQPRLLDIGTGAGIPGVLLAIARPTIDFTLLDSNIKKTRFVQQAAAQLGLTNVAVVHSRIEEWRTTAPYDVITCRAFASLPNIVKWTSHLLSPLTIILAMKGEWPLDELAETPDKYVVQQHVLQVPNLEAQRHVVALQQTVA